MRRRRLRTSVRRAAVIRPLRWFFAPLRHLVDTTRRQRAARGGILSYSGPTLTLMPRYDYRCRACGDTFEVSRPMAEATAPASCPQGHADTVKLLSTVAVRSGGAGPRRGEAPAAPSGGGCCGGACGC